MPLTATIITFAGLALLAPIVVVGAAPLRAPVGAPHTAAARLPPSGPTTDHVTVDHERGMDAAARAPAAWRVPSGGLPPDARAGLGAGLATARDSGRWIWPLSPPPAVERHFAIGPYRWSPGHRGVDLRAAPGARVRAPTSGTVSFSGSVAGRPVLVIAHANNIRTSYEPVTGAVAVGTAVAADDVVGHLAASGGHCGDRLCLHWGARRGEVYVDPLAFLQRPPIVLLPLLARR